MGKRYNIERKNMYYSNNIEEKIEDYSYSPETFPTHMGYFIIKLPSTALARLQTYADIPNKSSASHSLVGNITSSEYLHDNDDWFFKNYLEFMCNDYIKDFKYETGEFTGIIEHNGVSKHPFMLDSMWINHMKQGEFNPAHTHAGIFSFVIFIKIPTHFNEQHGRPESINSSAPMASNFAFEYMSELGQNKVKHIPMSSDWEGSMIFFPSQLRHQVYPFYNSEEDRITISGNLGMNTSITLDQNVLTERTQENIEEVVRKHNESLQSKPNRIWNN
jgi:hypothetical protein